jgi:hypothetical protein
MTVFEMQGVLRGKAIPGDMKVNESLAEYLVRKLTDAEAQGVEKFAEQQESKSQEASAAGAIHLSTGHHFAALQARAFVAKLQEGWE